MRRRSYLASTAAALSAAAAGCLSRDRAGGTTTTDPTTETTTTADPTTTTATTPAVSVSVDDLVLQPAAVELQTDYLTVHDAGQYVFLWATVEEGEVEYGEFSFRFAGGTHAPLAGPARRRLWRAYDAGDWSPHAGGLVAFELPDSAASDDPEAVLSHPGGDYEFGPALRARLAATTEFSFDIYVPETVAADDSLAAPLAATNEGDAPARFVGALNRSGPNVAMMPVETVRPLVAPGESWTLSVDQSAVPANTPADEVGDGEVDAEFTFNTVAGSQQRSVRVVEST